MRRIILGTAGHIDHGKTALIKALTGIDTDRLQEEKARGISIDLGFAYLDLPGGTTLGVVDVPGHERFIKNMLAGVGGIDLVLFVVACDEGVMPQTREHFDIVRLLGVKHAVFALTKSDMVEEEMVNLVREEVKGLVEGTALEGSPMIPTSTKTGRGLEEIREALEGVGAQIKEREIGEAVRLPIDRVFTMPGRGTVVTGTLWSGTISREDRLVILPGARQVRVRSIEVHGHQEDRAYAGQRTAVGLHGVEKREIERGHNLVSAGDFDSTYMIDVKLGLLASAAKVLKNKARLRFHLGASEVMGRAYLAGADSLEPGKSCFAQVRLESPIVAGLGDRFVIRTYSPMRTIGGGKVLDPLAARRRRRDTALIDRLRVLESEDLDLITEAFIAGSAAGIRLEAMRAKINCGLNHLRRIVEGLMEEGQVFQPSPGLFLHADALKELAARIEASLKVYQAGHRLTWGMPKEELREKLGSLEMSLLSWVLDRLEAEGRVFTKKGSLRAGSGEVELSPAETRARALVVELLKAKPFQPPSEREIQDQAGVPTETLRKVVNLLLEDGEIIRLEPGLIMHSSSIEAAITTIKDYLGKQGQATASDLKSILGTTRKYAVPLLEHLDRLGVTRRVGDKRTLVG